MYVLIVDDNPTNLLILKQLASRVEGCEPIAVSSAREALKLAQETAFDLAVVDNMMPDMNGIELISALRALPGMADLPIVMVTSEEERGIRHAALEAGATDFLTKPIDVMEFKIRLRNLRIMREARNSFSNRGDILAQAVITARQTLAQQEEELIMRLSRAIESRDSDAGGHVDRVARLCAGIAEAMGLDRQTCRDIFLAAPLHDIGKIGVPEYILRKDGPLDEAERELMRQHTIFGHRILADSTLSLIRTAADMALSHHERFDGSGYPNGLAGTAIPLSARILAVADVYDALLNPPNARDARTVADACAHMMEQKGRLFDPACVDGLLKHVHSSLSTRPGAINAAA